MDSYSYQVSLEILSDIDTTTPIILLYNSNNDILDHTEMITINNSNNIYYYHKLLTFYINSNSNSNSLNNNSNINNSNILYENYKLELLDCYDNSRSFNNFNDMKKISYIEFNNIELISLINKPNNKNAIKFILSSFNNMQWKSICSLTLQFIEKRYISCDQHDHKMHYHSSFLFKRPLFTRNNTYNHNIDASTCLKMLSTQDSFVTINNVNEVASFICHETIRLPTMVIPCVFLFISQSMNVYLKLRSSLEKLLNNHKRLLQTTSFNAKDSVDMEKLSLALYQEIHECDEHISQLFITLAELKMGSLPKFKPSTSKESASLQYLPTNFCYHFFELTSLPIKSSNLSQTTLLNTYRLDTITAGAIAAHSLGFKDGGLKEYEARYMKMLDKSNNCRIVKSQFSFFPVQSDEEELIEHPKLYTFKTNVAKLKMEQRLEITFSQALTIIVSGFCDYLYDNLLNSLDSNSTFVNFPFYRYVEIGFLFQIESLLSTAGLEEFMLSDMRVALRQLRNVKFRICSADKVISRSPSQVIAESMFTLSKSSYDQNRRRSNVGLETKRLSSIISVNESPIFAPMSATSSWNSVNDIEINEAYKTRERVAGRSSSVFQLRSPPQDAISDQNFNISSKNQLTPPFKSKSVTHSSLSKFVRHRSLTGSDLKLSGKSAKNSPFLIPPPPSSIMPDNKPYLLSDGIPPPPMYRKLYDNKDDKNHPETILAAIRSPTFVPPHVKARVSKDDTFTGNLRNHLNALISKNLASKIVTRIATSNSIGSPNFDIKSPPTFNNATRTNKTTSISMESNNLEIKSPPSINKASRITLSSVDTINNLPAFNRTRSLFGQNTLGGTPGFGVITPSLDSIGDITPLTYEECSTPTRARASPVLALRPKPLDSFTDSCTPDYSILIGDRSIISGNSSITLSHVPPPPIHKKVNNSSTPLVIPQIYPPLPKEKKKFASLTITSPLSSLSPRSPNEETNSSSSYKLALETPVLRQPPSQIPTYIPSKADDTFKDLSPHFSIGLSSEWPFCEFRTDNDVNALDISLNQLFNRKSVFATTSKDIIIDIGLSSELYNKIGNRDYLIPLVPILFNQGVNEVQSAAHQIGQSSSQDDLNDSSVGHLQKYYEEFCRYAVKAKDEHALLSIPTISDAIQNLENLINESKNTKNYDILAQASAICRLLGGVKMVCCKSAKDRTSMSVTAEQGTLIKSRFGFGQRDVQSMLDLFRLQGVRRNNVVANTGKPYYAFNALQRSFLPNILKPPAEACGKTVS